MANVGSIGIFRHVDDPYNVEIGTSEAAGTCWVTSTDTSDTAWARAVAAGKGVHYTAATYATDDNMLEFCSNNLVFTAQEGYCEVEILMQLDVVTTGAFFFGFSDDCLETAATLPVELATTTFTNRAATHCGIVYDVDADNDELHCHWADGGTNTTTAIADLRMKGMSPTAAKWLYMKVSLQDRGSGNGARATFLAVDHNGRSIEKEFNTSVTRSTPLNYWFGFENRSGVAHNVYIRHCNWAQSIADM